MGKQFRWMLLWLGLGLVGVAAAWLPFAEAQERPQSTKKSTKKAGVKKAVTKVKAAHEAAAGSQRKVEELSDEALDLSQQYRAVERRIASLKVYNDQLQGLLDNQEAEIQKLRDQLGQVDVVGRQVLPLMQRMVDSLERFIELDVPFLIEERTTRLKKLRELLQKPEVSNAEKYRRVVEAYQIENEYGRTSEAYKGKLKAGENEKSVEFLKIGRIALIYRTLDGSEYGVWDVEKKGWTPMTVGMEREIMAALRIAKEQAAPDLIRIPVPAPEAAQ